jgi:aldehyde dehydrogenase (NAD+)
MKTLEEKVLVDWVAALFKQQKSIMPLLLNESVKARKLRLKALRAWIVKNRSSIQHALFNDFKKPFAETDAIEIFPVLDELSFALKNIDRWTKPKKVDAPITMLGTRSSILYEPKGVCLIIAPWNYPFSLCIGPLISALSAGNAVVIKPSEITPNTSALIKNMCEEVFEDGVAVVCEGDAVVSQQLVALPFDHIFFTGSPEVGKLVMKAAAENLTSVTLELGGKSPVVVTPTTRLIDAAKRIAVAKFINNGQTCIAPDYVLVHYSIHDQFITELIKQVEALFTEGSKSFRESASYARIVSDKHFERVSRLLLDAIEKGAQAELGNEGDRAERFIPPTVLSNVSPECQLMKEEIFGPILPVLQYKELDECIDFINSRPKPLALYVFGSNRNELNRVLTHTSSGGVCINDCAIHFLNHNLPFGGVNHSGMGKAHGYYGFLAFSNEKPVLRQRKGVTSVSFLYPPYTKFVQRLLNTLIRLFS